MGIPQNSAVEDEAPRWFATTHWSVVLTATEKESPQAVAALERLCRIYWYPLYAYVRRKGYDAHNAQDLTQDLTEGAIKVAVAEDMKRNSIISSTSSVDEH